MKWWAFKPDTENPAHVSIETFYSPVIPRIFLLNAALIVVKNAALVFSKLFSCSFVWSNTTQANLDREAVQSLACRILWLKTSITHNPFA